MSAHKTEEVKYQARHVLHILDENPDSYETVIVNNDILNFMSSYGVEDNPDNRICTCAAYLKDVTFVTNDLACKTIARKVFGLTVESVDTGDPTPYRGYEDIVLSEPEMAHFYENLQTNTLNLLTNQYLILRDEDRKIVDKLKWDGEMYQNVKYPNIKTSYFGTVKPLNGDIYQQMALNSFATNQLTMIKGPAGTGKSYLALGYLMFLLEKHKIDKIVIFANPVPTMNSAKIGFLPGSQLDKLADSSIGNMLAGKLGDKYAIEQLVAQNNLLILPMCDIRGFDTSGMKAGIYMTEAQNLDISLMKLALQRIGEDSICIVDGDYNAQCDLAQYGGANNGMRRMSQVFRGADFYGEVELRNIYRSRIAAIAERM